MRAFSDLLAMLLVLASTQATTVLRHRVKRSLASSNCGAPATISAAVCATHTRKYGGACQMCGPNEFDDRDCKYLNKCVGKPRKHCISAKSWRVICEEERPNETFGLRSLDDLAKHSRQALNDLLYFKVESVVGAVGGGDVESKAESKHHPAGILSSDAQGAVKADASMVESVLAESNEVIQGEEYNEESNQHAAGMDAQADAKDVETLAREAEKDLVALSNMARTCMKTLYNAGPSPPLKHALHSTLVRKRILRDQAAKAGQEQMRREVRRGRREQAAMVRKEPRRRKQAPKKPPRRRRRRNTNGGPAGIEV